MTEASPTPKPKRAGKPISGVVPAPIEAISATAEAPVKPARAPRARKPATPGPAPEPAHRHPNLGKPPLDVTAGFPAAAEALRRDRAIIAKDALAAVSRRDEDFDGRFGPDGLAQLSRDAEVLIDRAALCVATDDPRPMAEYAEWIDPIFRRRRISLWDLAALCAAIRDVAGSRLDEQAAASLTRTMNAAIEVLRKNGRLGGDTHKRDALLQWLYKGV